MLSVFGRAAPLVTTIPYEGVSRTVADMQGLVRRALQGEHSVAIQALARDIVAQVRPKDYLSEIAALYYSTLVNGRYVRDPAHVERLSGPAAYFAKTPADALAGRRFSQGDCDEAAVGLASLAMALGNRASFVTVSAIRGALDHHVFVAVEPGGPASALGMGGQRMRVVLDPVPGPEVQRMLAGIVHWQLWPIEPVRSGLGGWTVPSRPTQSGVGQLRGIGAMWWM